MEQHFSSLSKRQTMLLLTAVTFGGAESVEAFDHLPDEESALLKHRAQGLLQIPRDKRIPLLVQEIKRLVTVRRRLLASADPARLARLLATERASLVEVVLSALPASLADAVRKDLPAHPPLELKHEVRPDILSIVRWKLEDALKQSAAGQSSTFKFTDLLTLQQRELLTICDRMGARALATAIAGLPDAEREAFLTALPPDQRSLAARATEAGKSRKLTESDSRTVMDIFGASAGPSAALRSAGAQRLARACVAQSPEFAARLIERHPGELGKLLVKWVKEERNRPVRGDGGRADLVEQMERLAQRGVIDRPMRLPPPPALRPSASGAQMPGGRLLPPPPRPLDPRGARGPVPAGRAPEPRSGQLGPRRDAIAEREARRAGAAGRHSAQPVDPRVVVTTDPKIRASRVLRDGKRLAPTGAAPQPGPAGKRAVASAPLQDIPRRRERPGRPLGSKGVSGLHRSKVVKGPGRGPGDDS